MGRGLVIGSTRLFAIADHLLRAANAQQSRFGCVSASADMAAPTPRFRTRVFTAKELSEAEDMLKRMGLLPRTPVEIETLSRAI
jgi:hypothetical protein